MLTREKFINYAQNFHDWCEYPAVKYKIKLDFLYFPYESLKAERAEFLKSDIVRELRDTQEYNGSWGKLFSAKKDPEIKTRFLQNTSAAVNRCVYIGLRIEDESDILTLALEHLEEILRDTSYNLIKKYGSGSAKNDCMIPTHLSAIANIIEKISPNNNLCDDLFNQWVYIMACAFEDGEYSPERDKKAQGEVFKIKKPPLYRAFIPFDLLFGKSRNLSPELSDAMRDYYAKDAYYHGYFWATPLDRLPANWTDKYTRRYFPVISYINQFRNTREYLEDFINWIESSKNQDNLWDYGAQVGFDPWGDWRYFSANKNYKYNRIVDCTMDVLSAFKQYIG